MLRHHRVFLALALAFAVLTGATAIFAQATPPAQPTTPAKTVWINPLRGKADIQYILHPIRVEKDGTIVTTIDLKNIAGAPIARLTIEEFWYDKGGNPVSGDKQFLRKPLMPGEVGTIVLRTPKNPNMNTNSYKFTHQNGDVNPKRVTKF